MYWRDKATLIAVTTTKDADGYTTEHETRSSVFVDVQSVKRSEFYTAHQAGIKIAIVFLVRAADLGNAERVEYGGKSYKIERAYTKAGEIYELNCSEEAAAQ